MLKVDAYLRFMKGAREDAAQERNLSLKTRLEDLANGWESLAKERLQFLEDKLQAGKLGNE
jgi:hypothetical protein